MPTHKLSTNLSHNNTIYYNKSNHIIKSSPIHATKSIKQQHQNNNHTKYTHICNISHLYKTTIYYNTMHSYAMQHKYTHTHTYILIHIQLRKTAQINNTYFLKYTKQQPQYTTTTVHHSVKEYNINHKIQKKEPPTPQQETQFNTKHRTSRYITSPSLAHTCAQ